MLEGVIWWSGLSKPRSISSRCSNLKIYQIWKCWKNSSDNHMSDLIDLSMLGVSGVWCYRVGLCSKGFNLGLAEIPYHVYIARYDRSKYVDQAWILGIWANPETQNAWQRFSRAQILLCLDIKVMFLFWCYNLT